MKNNYIKVALYLRLSKEDIDKVSNISESIKNQELMLRDEVSKHSNWKIVGIYCDEDFSGAGTYRPEFENMIVSCQKGEIDIVLCKSQSRFSRDIEVIEKYIHNKFLEWNVRFISLVDNIDTINEGNKKSRQINALVNEWFLEDLSNNIKATLKTKWKAGESTASFACYGLLKDPKNKNHLIIDPIASNVLKYIGTLIIKGYGQDKIANILNEKDIPSPYEYKLLNGSKLKLPILNKYKDLNNGTFIIKFKLYNNTNIKLQNLKTEHIINLSKNYKIKIKNSADNITLFSNDNKVEVNDIIITSKIISLVDELDRLTDTFFEIELTIFNEENIKIKNNINTETNINFEYFIRKKYKWSGKTIYNMMKNEIYNGTLSQGKTKRISYKNHHSIKVDKSNWISYENALEKIFDDEEWNKIQKILKIRTRIQNSGIKHIFFGKIYCNKCNNIFHKNISYNKKHEKIEYLICKDKKNKWKNCDNVYSIRIKDLENIILKEFNKLLKKYYNYAILKDLYSECNKYKIKMNIFDIEKNKVEKKILEKNNYLVKIYEDQANGIIDINDFKILKEKYNDDLRKYREKLNLINIEANNYKEDNIKDIFFDKYKKILVLNRELVNNFIDSIKIDTINNEKTRDIIINWNF